MYSANQYIKLRSNGWYYYIRRVPVSLRGRIKQKGFNELFYRVSLKTKDEREARRQAVFAHEVYEWAVRIETQMLRVADNKSQQAEFNALQHQLLKLGIHPSQAPTVNAPKEVQEKYLRDRDDFVWGKPRAEEGEMSLYDYKLEVGLSVVGYDDLGEPIYKPNERWDQVQQEIDFIQGNADSSFAYKDGVPTLEKAQQLYSDQIQANPKRSDFDKGKEVKRLERLVERLALQLSGDTNTSMGLSRTLDSITEDDAELFIHRLRQRKDGKGQKALSSVGRELTIIVAMYNHAEAKTKRAWPADARNNNPFANRRSALEEQHKDEVKLGQTPNLNRRAFTAEELETFFSEHAHRMNEEAQLIALIGHHTGCRIGDAAGLMMSDYWQGGDEEPIPFLHFQDNRLRRVTKDGFDRQVPLFGAVLDRLHGYLVERTKQCRKAETNYEAESTPMFPKYGRKEGGGADAASAVINRRIHKMRGDDKRLAFHSFRHTLQAKFLAASADPNFSSYIGGWKNEINKGLQAVYQKDGIPLKALEEALRSAHRQRTWGKTDVSEKMKRGLVI
jgi:integrase